MKIIWLSALPLLLMTVCSPAPRPDPHLSAKYTDGCIKDASTKRHLVVESGTIPVIVESSSRVSHRLVSEIFRILVAEALGYSPVEIRIMDGDINNPNKTLGRISGCPLPEKCEQKENFIPESMINLEVWLGPGFNIERWTSHTEIEDCGPLGPIGRAGWYVPEWMVSNTRSKEKKLPKILDHWRAFRDPEVASEFSLYGSLGRLTFQKFPTGPHYCDDVIECPKGIYRPPLCQTNKSLCATLLADYPKNNFEFLKKDILRYGLYVEVAWVGPNLESYVLNRTRSGQPVLFFNWKPNTLTSTSDFVNVAFPHCEDSQMVSTNDEHVFSSSCEFEINQMQKVIWRTIKNKESHIYHILRHFNIGQQDYEDLLKKYQAKIDRNAPVMMNDLIFEVACDWITDNDVVWHSWLPDNLHEKDKLVIGGIFPLSGNMWTQSGIAIAAKMAVDIIENNDTILSNYSLDLQIKDGKCQADVVMKAFIDYAANMSQQRQQLVGILGPACSETVEPIAGVAKHFNTIIISYSAEGSRFNDRERYPYFYRTIPENDVFKDVYLVLFDHFGWKRVAAMTEDGLKYPEYVSRLETEMQSQGKTFLNVRFPRDKTNNMTRYLKDIRRQNYKIIIGDFYDHSARAVMCEAYKQNMTAANGYLWFLPLWFARDWYDTDHYNVHLPDDQKYGCNSRQMKEVIQGHISLAYKFYADKEDIMQTGMKVGDWLKHYRDTSRAYDNSTEEEDDYAKNKEFSRYGGYAYDAVWVYALALDKLLKENYSNYQNLHQENVTKRFMEILNKTDFNGVSGRVHFEGSSRPSQIILSQWVDNRTNRIGSFKPSNTEGKKLEFSTHDIRWFTYNKKPPYDGTEKKESKTCVFEGLARALNIACDAAITVVNLIGFSLLIVLVIVLFIGFKKRYEAKFRKTEQRFRELGLLASSGMLALDEWEMPRDHIVINRKLGEGAFGTVYGGEAFIEERGWQAVAVKTLKLGANVEEKVLLENPTLDFLSEAEMMKRFDHTNVVRLIGVCTKGEPVYTVMEFMLYGDLKTYLLARRQLVKEPNRHTSEEVSDWQLTKMALDIARGLSYLAEQKYVHRDLACRNCLVNANRTVKIADFGMCRLMYDRDYYRFNKRGMLPVRWMSPESLSDGFFSPMSDVWSYAVLLYEMITFGSFPYQGLSNNQVIEYVKNFNTLIVPKGCKPELESLLLRCWNRDASQRPPACEIVEILAHHPELISPCLDMPLASVEVEDTDSIELTIHERSRVQSVSSSQGHVTPSVATVQQRRNRTTVERHPSLNGFTDVSNGGLVHSESSPMALHTRLLPTKGQYVTLHCRGNQDHSAITSTKDTAIGIASL